MKAVLDTVVYYIVRATFAVLALLPHGFRISLFAMILRVLLRLSPRLSFYAQRNLELAFPDATPEWRGDVLRRNVIEMARLISDAVRLPALDEAWVRQHVECPNLDLYTAALSKQQGKGILIATGHLGSFELLGHAIGLMGHPLAAVARNFRSGRLDRWWTATREARGNKIIGRKGAFKEMVSALQSGSSVAVLFDQNVTRNHAVFVDWFGIPAATSKSVALAALRTEVPIFVASIRYLGDEQYRIEALECDCRDIYRDATLTADEKVAEITQRLSLRYCEMIKAFPEGWFWIHRRWKTRPEQSNESTSPDLVTETATRNLYAP